MTFQMYFIFNWIFLQYDLLYLGLILEFQKVVDNEELEKYCITTDYHMIKTLKIKNF